MTEQEGGRAVVKSADRVLDIFELLAQKARPIGHTEFAAALAIPKSSLSQLLANLVRRQYLDFDPASGSYGFGAAFQRLMDRRSRIGSLPELAQPLCDRITRLTGESSSLNVLRENEVERLCGASSTQTLTYSMKLGERAPMYAVSSGKALLSTFSAQALDDYLAQVALQPITRHTITSAARLRKEIEAIRKSGVAWSIEEYTPGIVGLAVVARHEGEPVGAFNIALPKVRDEPEHRRRMLAALRDAAASLEKDLGAMQTFAASRRGAA